MEIMEFAKKAGYLNNGLLNIPLSELKKKFTNNKKMQKKHFVIKDKIKK